LATLKDYLQPPAWHDRTTRDGSHTTNDLKIICCISNPTEPWWGPLAFEFEWSIEVDGDAHPVKATAIRGKLPVSWFSLRRSGSPRLCWAGVCQSWVCWL